MKTPAAASVSGILSEFERRAARAELLSREAVSAADPLRFAAGLYREQGRIAGFLEDAHAQRPLTGHLDQDADRFLDRTADLLRYAAESGPEILAADAGARRKDLPATARARLLVYWGGDISSGEDYLSRALLRPYVETLRRLVVPPDRVHRNGRCPFCGGAPWVSARRDGSMMEGARRALVCSLCGGEWLFGRILCPSCFEEEPGRLPSFQNAEFSNVRIEACETCRRYVKSIDLSEDARPIPEVDDLVSIGMDLWALEQGFTRLEPGLAGL